MSNNYTSNIITNADNNILSYSYCWYYKNLNNNIVDIKNNISDEVNEYINNLKYNITNIKEIQNIKIDSESTEEYEYYLYYILPDPNFITIETGNNIFDIKSNANNTIDNYFKTLKTNYDNHQNYIKFVNNEIKFNEDITDIIIDKIKYIIDKIKYIINKNATNVIIEIVLGKIDGYYYNKENCIDMIKNTIKEAINGEN